MSDRRESLLAVLSLTFAAQLAAAAQSAVSSADLQRLDETVSRLRADVETLRGRDTALAR